MKLLLSLNSTVVRGRSSFCTQRRDRVSTYIILTAVSSAALHACGFRNIVCLNAPGCVVIFVRGVFPSDSPGVSRRDFAEHGGRRSVSRTKALLSPLLSGTQRRLASSSTGPRQDASWCRLCSMSDSDVFVLVLRFFAAGAATAVGIYREQTHICDVAKR